MPRLSERDLDYLTRIDHHDHEALIALDRPGGDIVGVARFVRTGPEEAEPAIVVADDWQGRGLGRQLMGALADRALDEGVRRFRAPVLAEKNFHRIIGGRSYNFYYHGAHLHMVVLQTPKASYWVVNTLVDSLSNETMIAIAKNLQPLAQAKPKAKAKKT